MQVTDAPTRRRLPAWAGPAAVAATAAVGCAYLAAVDPNESGAYPPCPFHALTGLWCPGCGSARTLRALTQGDLGSAVSQNVLLVLALPLLVWLYTVWAVRTTTGRELPTVRGLPRVAWVAALAVVALFGVLRNLPWAPFSALAP